MDQEERETKDFWWSIFSVMVVLGILGVFIYLGSVNNQNDSQRIEPGVGAGPGETVTSPTPSPTLSPTPIPIVGEENGRYN